MTNDINAVMTLKEAMERWDFLPDDDDADYEATMEDRIITAQADCIRQLREALNKASIHIGYLAAGAEEDKAFVTQILAATSPEVVRV